jgi:hypothetical protein
VARGWPIARRNEAPLPHLLDGHAEQLCKLGVLEPGERPEVFDRHHELAGVALGMRLVERAADQARVDLERVQRQRAREAHERMGLVTLGQRLKRRMQMDPVGLRESERPAVVEQELPTLLSDERPKVAPGRVWRSPNASGRTCWGCRSERPVHPPVLRRLEENWPEPVRDSPPPGLTPSHCSCREDTR